MTADFVNKDMKNKRTNPAGAALKICNDVMEQITWKRKQSGDRDSSAEIFNGVFIVGPREIFVQASLFWSLALRLWICRLGSATPEQLFPNRYLVLFPHTDTCLPICVAVLRASVSLGSWRDVCGTPTHGCASLLLTARSGEQPLQDAQHSCRSEPTVISLPRCTHGLTLLVPVSWTTTPVRANISQSCLPTNNIQAVRGCVC